MRKALFLIFFLLINTLYAKEAKLIRIMQDGSHIVQKFPSDTKNLVIYDSDSNGYKTIDIEGLENFEYLESLEFQSLPYLCTYNFLKNLKSCKKLYICTGHFFNLSILRNLTSLEVFEFYGYITNEEYENIRLNGIDLSFLPNLKEFVFEPININKRDEINVILSN